MDIARRSCRRCWGHGEVELLQPSLHLLPGYGWDASHGHFMQNVVFFLTIMPAILRYWVKFLCQAL